MDKSLLIAKVLSGKAIEREKEELYQWLAANEANRTEFDDIKLLWENVEGFRAARRADVHFYDGLRKIRSVMASRNEARARRKRSRSFYAMAVGLAFLVAVITFVRTQNEMKPGANLRFDNVSLEQAIHLVEAAYPVTVEVQRKEILNCRFTGVMHRTSSAEDVIRALTSATSLGYQPLSDSHSYLLVGNGCIPEID